MHCLFRATLSFRVLHLSVLMWIPGHNTATDCICNCAIVTVAGNVQDTATVNSRPKRCLRRFEMPSGMRPGEFFKLCSLCFKLHPLTCQPAGMSTASGQIHRNLWKPYLALTMWWIFHVILWVWLFESAFWLTLRISLSLFFVYLIFIKTFPSIFVFKIQCTTKS